MITVLEKIIKETYATPKGDNTWLGTCPCHHDSNPSLKITLKGHENKLPLLKCWGGCTFDELVNYFELAGLIKSKRELENCDKPRRLNKIDKLMIERYHELNLKNKDYYKNKSDMPDGLIEENMEVLRYLIDQKLHAYVKNKTLAYVMNDDRV